MVPGTAKDRGVLLCYRKMCRRKLGNYSMNGLHTNEGRLIKPAFQIAKNKVKLIGSQSTSINHGQSTSNLLSSSDLVGKQMPLAASNASLNQYGSAGNNNLSSINREENNNFHLLFQPG